MIKYFRIRRNEKAQKKLEDEQKKLKKEQKKKDYKKDLERLKEKALEYVLTISASDYVTGVGKKLTDYTFRLISVEREYVGRYNTYEGCLERMTREGEKINAEIIVDIKHTRNSCYWGTALIPKKKK